MITRRGKVSYRYLVAMLLGLAVSMSNYLDLRAMQQQRDPVLLTQNIKKNEYHAGILKKDISVDLHNATLEKGLEIIAQKAGLKLVYSENIIPAENRVSFHDKHITLEDALWKLLEDTNLRFGISSHDHLVVMKSSKGGKKIEKRIQQLEAVSGTVTDAQSGETLPGVNILVKGTSTGTSTDNKGHYELSVPSLQDTLVFSYVGYQTRQIPITGRTEINVKMPSQAISGQEMVVVGYGTQQKSDLTGSISSVNSSEIGDLSKTNVGEALSGKAVGVQVKTTSGAPGAVPQIKIRGVSSISAGTSPLYVVDGFSTKDIQNLSPNNIKSINILKDASATAIYGSRGANGVVIIKTKRGSAGETKVTFDTYFGMQKVSRIPSMMNAKEQAQYALGAMRNKNTDAGYDVSGSPDTWNFPMPPTALAVLEGQNTTDIRMIDKILHPASKQHYQLTASGGSDNVTYYISGAFLGQNGIVKESKFNRYSLRANINAKISKRLTLKVSLNPSFINESLPEESNQSNYGSYTSDSPVNKAMLWSAFFPAYNKNGGYFKYAHSDADYEGNPVAMVKEIYHNQKGARLLGNIDAEYKILDELTAKILVGVNLDNTNYSRFKPELRAFGTGGAAHNIASGQNNSSLHTNWLTEYTLHYKESFGNHNLSGVAGFTAQKDHLESNSLFSNRYPNNLVRTLNATSGIITDGSSDIAEWSMISYLARLNYNFNNKYYVTGTVRRDGSSRFGRAKKYGLFSSGALAWRISNENLLKNADFISNLKLRVSYGLTGNNNIGNYEHLATIVNTKYTLGGVAVQGLAPERLANPSLTWETQKQADAGLDLGLFDDRINFTVDYFRSKSSNLLLNVSIPSSTGFSNRLKNIGEVKNAGWEFSVGSTNLRGKFEWTTNFNISTYKNKVVKLGPAGNPIFPGGGLISGSFITKIGEPMGMFYGLKTDGIFRNQAEVDKGPVYGGGTKAESRPGDIRFVDVNGDGIINSADRTIMGSPYPDFYYGMTNHFSYKNFSLSITLNGTQGNEILNMAGIGQLNMRGDRVAQSAKNLNYWKSPQEPGDGHTPRPNDAPKGDNREMSQRYLDNGSFLRINNISFSYLLPDKFYQSLKLYSLKVYFNATNPFTFTKNKTSFNPDVSNSNDPLTPGVAFDDYPLPKSFIIGLNVGF